PYPHAVRVGDFVFVSGMGPRQRGKGNEDIPGVFFNENGRVVSHCIKTQTRATIENIKSVLEEAGSCLEEVVDVTCFLTDMEGDFSKFNEIYGEYFESIGPARTTIEVNRLPTKIAVELKVIAYSPQKNPKKGSDCGKG
ncbi:MAG: RidA family protein, partial [Bdellovibrio sp.]